MPTGNFENLGLNRDEQISLVASAAASQIQERGADEVLNDSATVNMLAELGRSLISPEEMAAFDEVVGEVMEEKGVTEKEALKLIIKATTKSIAAKGVEEE